MTFKTTYKNDKNFKTMNKIIIEQNSLDDYASRGILWQIVF